jgi:hypothetical protein
VKKLLDSRRGRTPNVSYKRVLLSAEHYYSVFNTRGLWDRLWPMLKKVKTERGVARAFMKVKVPEIHYFVPSLTPLILKVIRDPKFPKGPSAQIRHLADALAARGAVAPRRSIDIVQEERAKAKAAHHILRYEYFVVCSCGYEGPSFNWSCAKCGAPIVLPPV